MNAWFRDHTGLRVLHRDTVEERRATLARLGDHHAARLDLAEALFHAAGQPTRIDYVDMPAGIRERYQYFTQAEMGRLLAAGYQRPFASLEDGIADYVHLYLSQADPYR